MSQGSSNPASPSRPVPASDPQETVIPVSHVFGLSEASASFKALNIDLERKPNVVHQAQTSYSPGASWTQGSPNAWDCRRSTPASPHKPKRYALQLWLEVEVGPGYFLPPEDDSFSMDFTLKALNHAYPGCTGVYLDRGGHMLAFYGRKGSPKAGLIQEVATEAGHAVAEIPTWMGLIAKWRVKCVSSPKPKISWLGARDSNRRLKGESVCNIGSDSPPCTSPQGSQLLCHPSSHGPPYPCLDQQRCPVVHWKWRGGGQGPASPHLATRLPLQLVKYLHP